MAITEIHSISQTPDKAIRYVMADKVETVLREDVSDRIPYSVDEKTGDVTYYTLSCTQWCTRVDEPERDFRRLIHYFGQRELRLGCARSKDGEAIVAWHLTQSFDSQIDPRIANEIGRKLAEEIFPGHPAVISTHTNTDKTHNHIVACAWNRDGVKYNSCHETYQAIRRKSDALCAEYGLPVLEQTREQKLTRWKDRNGRVRYFEPTARKDDLRQLRKEGKCSPDNVGSYRNTFAYEIADKRKQTNREIVRQAIEEEILFVSSYNELLQRLRERGYQIKDKKQDGQWLENITFIASGAQRGVRDSSLGEGYCREKLTARIERQSEERQHSAALQEKLQLPLREEYGLESVCSLHEDYRAYRDRGGFVQVRKRQPMEKPVVQELKKLGVELDGLIDTTRLHQLVTQQRMEKKKPRSTTEEDLVARIQESFENLRFIEQRNIHSYQEVEERVQRLRTQIEACEGKIGTAEQMIARISDSEKAEGFRERADLLRDALTNLKGELRQFERCMAVLERTKADRTAHTAPPATKKKQSKERER